ncbi:MAG: hypothetical protein Q4F00_02180 [bacterium]|nr:hypothetical protein [bacterium]
MTSNETPESGLSTPFCIFISVVFPIMGLIFLCMYPNDDKGKLSLLAGILSGGIAYAVIMNS